MDAAALARDAPPLGVRVPDRGRGGHGRRVQSALVHPPDLLRLLQVELPALLVAVALLLLLASGRLGV